MNPPPGPGPAPASIPRVILNELEHETFDRFIRSGRGQGLAFAERNVKLGDCGNVYRGNFHLYQNLFDEYPSIRRPPVVHKIEEGGVYVTSPDVITRVHDHGLQFVINAEHGAFAAYPLGVHKWTIDDEGPIIRYLLKHGVQLAETVEQDEYMIVTHIENAFAGMNAIWTNELRFKTDPPTCGFERNNAAEEFCATPELPVHRLGHWSQAVRPVGDPSKTAFVAGITVAIALDALSAVGSDGHVQSAQVHLPAPAVCFWCKFLSWNRAQDAQEVPKSPSETYQAKRIISDFLLYHSAHVLKMAVFHDKAWLPVIAKYGATLSSEKLMEQVLRSHRIVYYHESHAVYLVERSSVQRMIAIMKADALRWVRGILSDLWSAARRLVWRTWRKLRLRRN